MARFLIDDEVAELWDRYSRGETSSALTRRFRAGAPMCCPTSSLSLCEAMSM